MTKFNKIFTSIARNLCHVFKDSAFSQILVPRVKKGFVLHAVDTGFVLNKVAKLKLSKASGLDKIPAELLKDASSAIARPVTHLTNLTISTSEMPSHWKEPRVTIFTLAYSKKLQNSAEYTYDKFYSGGHRLRGLSCKYIVR